MEKRHTDIIQRKLPDLLRAIMVTEALLSHVGATCVPSHEIEVIRNQIFAGEGNASKVVKLLDSPKNKTDGWDTLITSLRQTGQTGALEVLGVETR